MTSVQIRGSRNSGVRITKASVYHTVQTEHRVWSLCFFPYTKLVCLSLEEGLTEVRNFCLTGQIEF